MKSPHFTVVLCVLSGLVAAPAFAQGTTKGSTQLLQVVRLWANDVAKKNGTEVEWIDLHGKNPALQQYPDQKVIASAQNCAYTTMESKDAPPMVFPLEVINRTDEKPEQTDSIARAVKHVYSWTVNNTVEDGWELSFDASLAKAPAADAAGGGSALKFTNKHTVKLSTDTQQTEEELVTWTSATKVPVSPRVRQTGRLEVDMKNFTGTFACDVTFRGNVAVWFKKKIALNNDGDLHYLWFPSVASVLQQHPEPSFQVQGDAVIKKVTGNFEGFQGMGARLDLDEPVRLAGGTPPAPSQSQPQTQPQTQAQPQAQAQPQPDPDSGQQHTYQEGETFYSLAEQYYGDGEQWPRIRDANPELDPDNLEAGQVITIP